jgi:hypothetical protein
MLAMLAMSGDPHAIGYDTVCGYATVDPKTGANFFREDANGPHRYVKKREEDSFYTDPINSAIA